jgi:tRNA (adenine57-N1/adenine58-N1)-methyltransferase
MWLMDERGRVHKTEKDVFETDLGKLKIEGEPGKCLKTHKGKGFWVIKPEFPDFEKKMKRGPQTIKFKDLGFIAAKIGLREGYRVLDAGAGSGMLTCFMAGVVGDKGKVYSYDRDDRSLKVTQQNIDLLGLKNVELIKADIYKGIKQKELDAITLDLAEPLKALKHAKKALKKTGFLAIYLPNMTQVQEFLKKNTMHLDSITEILQREWDVSGKICRPKHHMLAHTGFIIILRNL